MQRWDGSGFPGEGGESAEKAGLGVWDNRGGEVRDVELGDVSVVGRGKEAVKVCREGSARC